MPGTARLEDIESTTPSGRASLDDIEKPGEEEVSKAVAAVPRPTFQAPKPDLASRAVDAVAPRPIQHAEPSGEIPGSFEGKPENIAPVGGVAVNAVGDVGRGLKKVFTSGGTPQSAGARTGPTPEPQTEEEKAEGRQVLSGSADLMRGGGTLMLPATGAAAISKPLSTALWMAAGYGAQKGTEKLVHGKVSPETEDFLTQLAMFAPQTAATLSGLHGAAIDLPEGQGAGVSAFGDRVRAGVAVTPEQVAVSGKVGPFQGRVNIPRGPQPRPALDPQTIEGEQVSSAIQNEEQQAMRVASGLPPMEPVPPPPGPPPPPKINEVGQADIAKIAKTISQVPQEHRAQALLEAHDTLGKVLLQQGKFIDPDGKIQIVDPTKPEQATKLATQFLNDEIDRQQKAVEEAAKAKEQPTSKPVRKRSVAAEKPVEAVQEPVVQTAHVDDIEESAHGTNNDHLPSNAERGGVQEPAPNRAAVGEAGKPGVVQAGSEGASGTAHISEVAPKPTEAQQPTSQTKATQWKKGDRFVTKDGTEAIVEYSSPSMRIVRARDAEGNKFTVSGKAVDELKAPETSTGAPVTSVTKSTPKPSAPIKTPLDEFEAQGKEPWQISQKEWVDLQKSHRRALGQSETSGTVAAPTSDWEAYHHEQVTSAVKAGKDVPASVVKEYPDVQKFLPPSKREALEAKPATAHISQVEAPKAFHEPEHPHLEVGEHREHTEMVATPTVEKYANENVQMVPTSELDRYKEFDRRATPHPGRETNAIDALKEDISKDGLKEPLILKYGSEDRKAHLWEGNHRLAAAKELGIKELPVRVITAKKTEDHYGVGVRGHQAEGAVPADLKPSDIGIESRPLGEKAAEKEKPTPELFHAIGHEAFAAGKKRVPAHDPKLTPFLKGADAATTNRALTQWLQGWDKANLAAPVDNERKIETEKASEPTTPSPAPASEGRREVSATPENGRGKLAGVEPRTGEVARSEGATPASTTERSGTDDNRSPAVREEGPSAGSGEGNRVSEPVSAERGPKPERVKAKNQDWFAHPEDFSVDATPSTRLEWNTKALTILKNVLDKDQKLTAEDRDALAHYVGWGALDKVFNPGWGGDADMWHRAARKLEELMTPEELAAARRSTQNAHYTSPQIVRFVWSALARMGFKGGVVLEPSMGTGNFLGMMPKGIRNSSQAIGNELDPTTYNIAKLLYPSATTFNKDFIDLMMPNDSVDLAVSNVPFGVQVYDPVYRKFGKPAIHDYFFLKSLDKVRHGGLLAYITSTYTLDKESSAIRDALADKADLVYAIRMPQDTFDKSSGTAVSTDLIVLRKRAPGAEATGEPFGGLRDVQAKYEPYFYDRAGTSATKQINEYYAEHPENVLGDLVIGRGRTSANPEMLVAKRTDDFEERLKKALERVPRNAYQTKAQAAPMLAADMDEQFAPDSLQEGNYAIDDKGVVRQRLHGKLVATEVNRDKDGKISHSLNERLKDLISIRDATKGLMLQMRTLPDDELSNKQIAKSQAKLAKDIEKYRSRHGWFGEKRTKDVFYEDPHYPLLLSLEDYDKTQKVGTAADILSKRTIYPEAKLTTLSSDPKEAFYQVLGDRGRPDLEFMAGLSGKTVEEIAKPLVAQGLVFKEPNTHEWQVRSKYLSGYVRDKLADAKKAVAQGHKEFESNVHELEKVQPATVPINSGDPDKDIQVKLGATWVDGSVVEQFAKDVLKSGYYATVKSAAGQWSVDGLGNSAEMAEFGGGGLPASTLLELALNLKQPVVKYSYKDEHGNIREAVDADKTIAAKKAQHKLKEEFAKWARNHKTIGPKLEKIYNETVNNLVEPTHDGSHLTFPGMNKSVLRGGELQPHQSDAVWRTVQDGRALLAHVVGAGKTYEMIASAMEMKRLGMIRKPMFAVPNHLVGQWAKDFLKLYPGAKILVPEKKDFEAVRRNRIMSKIATGDWDAIILPHSQFNLMDISPEYQQKTLNKELEELEETYNAAKAAGEGKRSFTVKRLEKARDRLRSRLAELKDMKSDKTVRFDDLGVDQLFVDEAHAYKNLSFYTKMERVAGLAQGDSKRAIRLKMKTDYLLDKHDNRGVVFATGTPIQNTMAEMYNMIKYIAPDVLTKAGIRYFDDWAANFGETITAMELGVDGRSYKPRSKFARFTNVPELQQMFRSFADVKTNEDLNLPIPKIEGGKPQPLIALPTPELEDYVKQLIERAKRCRGEGGSRPDPREDNMLKVTGDGRKAATDMRLIDPNYPDDPDSKINTVVNKAFEEWESGKADKLTQAIFLDNYQYLEEVGAIHDEEGNVTKKGKETALLNLYRDMADKLIAKGVPKNEIAIIHDYEKQEQKTELFRKMNAGEVRVLFGSTEKMGAGMNAQQRMKSLIDVDSPWRPGDLEQRHGRILRQGNMNDTVRIYHAVTKGTFDSYMIQTLKGKAEFINQVMSGKFKGRTMTDAAGDMVLSLEEMLAASSNNPDVKKKMELEAEVATLGALEREHEANMYRNRRNAETERDIAARRETESTIWKKVQTDWAKATAGDKFSFDILGKKFAEYKDAADWIKDQDAPAVPFHFELNGIPMRFEVTGKEGKTWMTYTAPTGELRSVDNFPSLLASSYAYLNPKNVQGRIEFANQEVKRAGEKAAKLEALAEKSGFEDAERLKAAKAELENVKQRLGLSDQKAAEGEDVAAAVDSTPDKPEPGEEDEEPQTIPGESKGPGARQAIKEAITSEVGTFEPGKIRDYIDANLKELRGARNLERGTFDLEKRHDARVLRAKQLIEAANKKYGGKDAIPDYEQIYHHLEDPRGEQLNKEQDEILDSTILPIMEQNDYLYHELKDSDVPIDNYVHRVVKGKGGWFDRILSGVKGTGKGNVLSKSAPQTKGRTMMAIESPDGDERRVVSIKGGKATMWENGQPTELGEVKNARGRTHEENATFPEGQPNSAFYDEGKVVEGPDGYDWKITQATTKEIEAHTELRYYHNALASALVSNLQLAKALDAARFVEAFKQSDEFPEIAFPEGHGAPPKGWRITQLPQFKGYYFEPHYADVLDRYAQKLQTTPSALDQVGAFMRVAMLLNPIMHPLNVGASWAVDRGVTGFLPHTYMTAAKAGMRAVKAVATQNDDFLHALDEGAPLQSHREATRKITQLFFDQLGEGLRKEEPWALKAAKSLSMAPITLIKALHNFSSKVAWISNDILFLQAAYERQAHGVDFVEALHETGRTIPEYRLPAHILNSRLAGKVMESQWATIFGSYHYGLLRSFAEAGKSALGLNESPAGGDRARDVAKGWDRLALIGLVVMAMYPLLDELAKKATGDEHARAKRFGPFAVIDAWAAALEHRKTVGEAAQTSVTPAPQTKAIAELAMNREFYSGRQIYNPHDSWQTEGEQLGHYLLSQVGQVGQAVQSYPSASRWRKYKLEQVGVQLKPSRAEKVAQDIARSKTGTAAAEPGEMEKYGERHDIIDALRNGDRTSLEKAEARGDISRQQAHHLQERARRSPLEDTVYGFTYSEVMKVMDAAEKDGNQEQVHLLDRVLQRKRLNMWKRHETVTAEK